MGERTIKTDTVDLEAMTELLLAGRGWPVRDSTMVLAELTAWSAHRISRVQVRTATKTQLLGQLPRARRRRGPHTTPGKRQCVWSFGRS